MAAKPLIGLAGVIVGVAFSELNDQVIAAALPDVIGGLGISLEAASWLRTLYLVGLILGALTGPALAVIFTARRFLTGAIALVCVSSLAFPLSNALPLLYASRTLQGLGEGLIIANLIATALKTLPPATRLYGLVFYAMTATVIPSLAVSLAALWTDVVGDWRFALLQSAPLALVAGALAWTGLPEEPPQYGKLKTFDWPGALLGTLGFGALAVLASEGEQFDWFNAPAMSIAALVGAVATPLFLAREATAVEPLVGLDLLKQRNLLYAVVTLIVFIVLGLSASQVPVTFLQEVQGYRPLQAQVVSAEIAGLELLVLPATAWLLDQAWADARAVSAVGFLCILLACLGGVLVDSSWVSVQFAPIQALQALGQPLVLMPLLMMATNALKPDQGPRGAALVNAPRALSEASGGALLTLLARWRGALHQDRILDALGQNRIALAQAGRLPAAVLRPMPGGSGSGPGAPALRALRAAVQAQTTTLVTIDTYVLFAAVAMALLVLVALLPQRTLPPRLALAQG